MSSPTTTVNLTFVPLAIGIRTPVLKAKVALPRTPQPGTQFSGFLTSDLDGDGELWQTCRFSGVTPVDATGASFALWAAGATPISEAPTSPDAPTPAPPRATATHHATVTTVPTTPSEVDVRELRRGSRASFAHLLPDLQAPAASASHHGWLCDVELLLRRPPSETVLLMATVVLSSHLPNNVAGPTPEVFSRHLEPVVAFEAPQLRRACSAAAVPVPLGRAVIIGARRMPDGFHVLWWKTISATEWATLDLLRTTLPPPGHRDAAGGAGAAAGGATSATAGRTTSAAADGATSAAADGGGVYDVDCGDEYAAGEDDEEEEEVVVDEVVDES